MQTDQKQLVVTAGASSSLVVIGYGINSAFPDLIVPFGWSLGLVGLGCAALLGTATFAYQSFIKRRPLELQFLRVEKAAQAPDPQNSAIRLVVQNLSRRRLDGLTAQMIAAVSPVEAYQENFQLPLTLATKAKLDALRQQGLPLSPASFSLNARAETQIELCWLGTAGALEFYITHEAGVAEFMLLDGYTFEIEISGEADPVTQRVRLFVTNEETNEWDCELLAT